MIETDNDDQQVRVRYFANEIMRILAGLDENEACTSLTIAVVATICGLADNTHDARLNMAAAFYRQVVHNLERPDVVAGIRANTTKLEPTLKQ